MKHFKDWPDVFKNLGAERRSTASRRIVDSLEHYVPGDLQPVVGLFGDDLARAFADGDDDSLVRQIAEPIVKDADENMIVWLNAALDYGQKFWTFALDDDKTTFSQSLWYRVSHEDSDDIKNVLRGIARRLDLQEPEDVESEIEEDNDTDKSNADS